MSKTSKPAYGATPIGAEWNEVKESIKNLTEALLSLNPQQSSEGPKVTQRNFNDVSTGWLEAFVVVPQTNLVLIQVLLSIFLRSENEYPNWNAEILKMKDEKDRPSFADELTLRLPEENRSVQELLGAQEFNALDLGKLLKNSSDVSSFCDKILNSGLWNLNVDHDPITDGLLWRSPKGGKFEIYRIIVKEGQATWKQPRAEIQKFDGDDENGNKFKKSGYGALCLIQAPVHNSILESKSITLILAQTYICIHKTNVLADTEIRKNYSKHLGSIAYFLGIFVGFWPSRIERSKFSKIRGMLFNEYPCCFVQIHFRSFQRTTTSCKSSNGAGGLLCQRQRGQIPSFGPKGTTLQFEERRMSIFGTLSESSPPRSFPAMYRVLILTDTDLEFSFDSELQCRAGLEGTITFHAAIFATVGVWETEWNIILDQVDECLKFQLSQTIESETIKRWMFDDNFELSRIYFTILQTLNIFGDCIETVSADLGVLDNLFRKPHEGFPQSKFIHDELLVLRSNWESIIEYQKGAEQRLLSRLLNKTEEVKSLRDGLFNASSLREANRSTTMNRFVTIFTVVTVIYLPPSFISTVFAVPIFEKGKLTIRGYIISMVIVSLVTYFVALGFILFVAWWYTKREKTEEGKPILIRGAPAGPPPTPLEV